MLLLPWWYRSRLHAAELGSLAWVSPLTATQIRYTTGIRRQGVSHRLALVHHPDTEREPAPSHEVAEQHGLPTTSLVEQALEV